MSLASASLTGLAGMAVAGDMAGASPIVSRTAMTQDAAGSSLCGKCFGWVVIGMPSASRQRASSCNRYAWRCGERFGSGSPPDPAKMVPGTSMGYAGVKDAQERIDLLAYLKQAGQDEKLCPKPH